MVSAEQPLALWSQSNVLVARVALNLGRWAALTRMKEYKTVSIETNQGWGGARGTANTTAVDAVLNAMAADGWELACIEDLKHTAGTGSLLCVFCRERNHDAAT